MRLKSKKWPLGAVGATLAVLAPIVVAVNPATAADSDAPSSIVEDFSYPGAAEILAADPRINLISGDGHIVLNDTCGAPANGVGRISVATTEGAAPICFDVLAAEGWLTMKINAVYSIDGRKAVNSGADNATATVQPEGGNPTDITLDKQFTTPVGIGNDPNDPPATLLELKVTEG